MYYIDVSNCISINLSTPDIMFLPQLLQSLQLLLLSEMVPSQTAGWRFHRCEWRWQQGQVQGNDRMEQHVSTLQLRKSLELGAEYISYINLQCHDCDIMIYIDIYCDPDSLLLLPRGFKAPLALSLSPWAANWHLSCKQCIHCIQKPELFLQLTCANMRTIHLFSTGYPTRAVLYHVLYTVSRTNMTLACKSSVAMSVRVFVQVSWHCYSAIVLGISG